MIDSRELRIGNYVSANINDIVRNIEIHAITTGGVSEYGGLKEPENPQSTYDRKWINIDDINPISLTEDILVKCGFRNTFNLLKQDDKKWRCDNGNFHIRLRDGHYKIIREINSSLIGGWIDVEFGDDGGMDYLHQLQNVIRDLTGEELEVKL